MNLSVVIPAYNESKRILPSLEKYHSFFADKLKKDFEIIVVANNCTDNTFEIVKEFFKDKPEIKILNFPFYTGKGGAVIKGFKISKGDYVGFTDADNSTSPEEFFKLYKNIGDHHGIIASRKTKGAKIYPKRTIGKESSSYLFNLVVHMLFNLKFKDTQCGAKLFKRKISNLLAENSTEKGWIFDVDLLCICKKNNLKILEYPILWKDSEGSKLSYLDGILSIFDLVKFRLKNLL